MEKVAVEALRNRARVKTVLLKSLLRNYHLGLMRDPQAKEASGDSCEERWPGSSRILPK